MEPVKELMDAIGGLAELSGAFYKRLIENGFTAQQALYLTGELVREVLSGGRGKGGGGPAS